MSHSCSMENNEIKLESGVHACCLLKIKQEDAFEDSTDSKTTTELLGIPTESQQATIFLESSSTDKTGPLVPTPDSSDDVELPEQDVHLLSSDDSCSRRSSGGQCNSKTLETCSAGGNFPNKMEIGRESPRITFDSAIIGPSNQPAYVPGEKNGTNTSSQRNPKKPRKFYCHICRSGLCSVGSLKKHVAVVHERNFRHPCTLCERKFVYRSELTYHMKVHSKDRPLRFQCGICHKRYAARSSYTYHQQTHSQEGGDGEKPKVRKTFPCSHCESEFQRPDLLDRHCRIYHGNTEWVPVIPPGNAGLPSYSYSEQDKTRLLKNLCYVCGERFHTPIAKRFHMKAHNGIYKMQPVDCPQCGRTLRNKLEFNNHMRSHSGEKPFSCPNCHKKFREYSRLKFHIEVEHDVKQCTCEECGRAFKHRKYLTSHIKAVHAADSLTCKVCQETFKTNYRRIIHQATQHGVGYACYACSECWKSFKTSIQLRHHIQSVHNNPRRDTPQRTTDSESSTATNKHTKTRDTADCQYCGKSFTTKTYRNRHEIAIHTKDYPCACKTCQKGFFTLALLKKHEKFEHGRHFFNY